MTKRKTNDVKRRTLYRSRPGSRLSHTEAQAVGVFCERLEKQYGHVTAEIFVRESRRDKLISALLTWDEKKAAHLRRLDEARLLMRSYIVVVHREDKEVAVRGLQYIDSVGGYVSSSSIVKNTDLAFELLVQARKDLLAWYNRYLRLRDAYGDELGTVFSAIEPLTHEDREEHAGAGR